MYKLGITGGMGSGKSTASNFFLKKGALVFDADKQAKKYLLTDLNIQNRIIDAFGNYVIQNNDLDLLKLSNHVFSNKKNQEILNKLIWPGLYSIIESTYKKAKNSGAKLFIVDAALIIEAQYTNFFDSILLITANKEVRIKRIQLRNNIPNDQIKNRMALQMSESKKRKYSDTIIENNDSLDFLHDKLELFWRNLNIH